MKRAVSPHPFREPGRPALAAVLVFALALALYFPTLQHGFTNYDDPVYVTRNLHIQQGFNGADIAWAFQTFHGGNYIPFTWMSFMLDTQVSGMHPRAFHLTNLLLHGLNGVLLFALVQSLTKSLWSSALVAALFVAHPLGVESTAWITARKDLLSAFFMFVSLLAYSSFVRHPGNARYLLVGLPFVAGCLSKPTATMLPLVFLALDFWPLGRFHRSESDRAQSPAFRLVAEKLPFLALSLVIGLASYRAQQTWGALSSGDRTGLLERLLGVPVAYTFYLTKMFFPFNLQLVYLPPPGGFPLSWSAGSALLLVALTFLMFRSRKKPYLITAWAWYLATLLPASGLVRTGYQLFACRFSYIPLVGLFLGFVWGGREFARARPAWRILSTAAGLLVVAALAGEARIQVGLWRDDITLFGHELTLDPDNWVAHNNLGSALSEKGSADEATRHFLKSIRANPAAHEAYTNIAATLLRAGRNQEAENYLRTALSLKPGDGESLVNLGTALSRLGKIDESIALFREAMRLHPQLSPAYYNLGNLLTQRGRYQEAQRLLEEAVRIDPASFDALTNLGVNLLNQKKPREALPVLARAAQLKPESADASFNLGLACESTGDAPTAARHFSRALELNPADGEARQHFDALRR